MNPPKIPNTEDLPLNQIHFYTTLTALNHSAITRHRYWVRKFKKYINMALHLSSVRRKSCLDIVSNAGIQKNILRLKEIRN